MSYSHTPSRQTFADNAHKPNHCSTSKADMQWHAYCFVCGLFLRIALSPILNNTLRNFMYLGGLPQEILKTGLL